MNLPHKTVGIKEPGAEYYERPGAYIIPVCGNKVAFVRHKNAYALIGGGKEPGESNEECLIREVMEETGYSVKIGECFATAEQYKPDQTDIGYFHPFQFYYTGELIDPVCERLEKDHFLEWIDINEASGRLFLEMQEFALSVLRERRSKNE